LTAVSGFVIFDGEMEIKRQQDMESKDYYKILGVQRTASNEQIKKAYYRLIRKCHPDVCDNTSENLNRFLEITEAYKTLGDLEKRLQYSISLNKDLLNEQLLHRKFKISGYNNGYKKIPKIPRIVVEM